MIILDNKYKIALDAALNASKKIMELYNTDFDKETKSDGSPVTNADLASSKLIKEYLDKTNLPIIGEELKKQSFNERKTWGKCWCVDPLDGTKEFIKKNGEFVVNIALIEKNKAIFGVIASPVFQKVIFGGEAIDAAYYSTFENISTVEKWEKLKPLKEINKPPIIISSRSHFSGDLEKISNKILKYHGGYKTITMGSALKFFELCLNRADVYPRLAPTMEWDIAAGHAIFSFLGGEIYDFKLKKPLTYNKKDLFNPYFIAKKKAIIL